MIEKSNLEVIDGYLDVIWNQRRLSRLGEFLHGDCRFSGPYGDTRLKGIPEIHHSLEQWFSLFGSHQTEMLLHVSEGGNIAWQWRIIGFFSKEAPSAYSFSSGRKWPVGKECVIAGTTFSKIINNRIAYEETLSDTRGFIEQMGYRLG